MRLSIKYKLFLAILSAHIIVYVAMYSIGRYNFDRGFLSYISRIEERQVPALVEGLSDFYTHTGAWEPLLQNPGKWASLIRESIEISNEPDTTQPRISERPSPARLAQNDWYYSSEYSPARPYLLLLDAEENQIFGNPEALPLANLYPIEARGEIVGFLGVTSRQELSEQADLLFSEQQKQSFLIFAIVLVLISAMIAFPLSSIMVRPIREIVSGTRALTSGDYSSRIKVRSSDELANLSNDFNTLALTLEHNRQARQQWIADISHELRTPLAILRGELESIQDGIRPLSKDSLESLHSEVIHLNSLVNDLHELSLSDLGALVYEKEAIDLPNLIEQNLTIYATALANEKITVQKKFVPLPESKSIELFGDPKRLSQLISNLLQNNCRYTEKGGTLLIELKETNDEIILCFSDSGPGVEDKDLSKLFDRLYRVDSSRNRQQGGSGLGLAISKNIVDAHNGQIEAQHSDIGGLMIKITFLKS